VPDVIGFADYVRASKSVADSLSANRIAGEAQRLLLFPYPKADNRLRWLHVASPEDLILLRAAAGRVVKSTDALLSGRVYSSRLDPFCRCWSFDKPRRAYSNFRKHALSLLDGRRHSAMYRTDIAGYYPSVDIGRLSSLLKNFGCWGHASRFILKNFREWQLRDDLQGIPIGPEVSAVIGNFFLIPLDRALETNGYQHLRWSDDILLFGTQISNCQDMIAVVDEVLADVGLTRSVSKTLPFDNVFDARKNIEDYLLTSLAAVLKEDEHGSGTNAVRQAFDEQVVNSREVDPRRFRWIITTLLNKSDPYGCRSLARAPSLMNVDPKLTGEYLGKVALSGKRIKDNVVVDSVMRRFLEAAEDLYDALDLHLLKAMSRRGFGDAESKEFRRIATTRARRWPIRVYAWAAYIKSTRRYSELMEAARAETTPQLRRGMITTLKGQCPKSFLSHARANFPESRYVTDWLRAA